MKAKKTCQEQVLENTKESFKLGTVGHTCSPSYSGGRGGRLAWAQEFEASLGNIVRLNLKKEKKRERKEEKRRKKKNVSRWRNSHVVA
jgi:hypothetical protein